MTRRLTVLLALVASLTIAAAPALAQINMCETEIGGITTLPPDKPFRFYFASPDHGHVSGSVAFYKIYIKTVDGDQQVKEYIFPANSMAIVAGTTDCYATPEQTIPAELLKDGKTQYRPVGRIETPDPSKVTVWIIGNPFVLPRSVDAPVIFVPRVGGLRIGGATISVNTRSR